MKPQEPLRVEVRANPNPIPSILVPPEIVFELQASCPYCGRDASWIKRWGPYNTKSGDAQRYWCKGCKRTFNAAKLPEILNLMHQVAWRLAELVIRDGHAVLPLAKELGVPEKTLREVVNAIRDFLAVNLEVIKEIEFGRTRAPALHPSGLRVVFIDEGFIKVAGTQWYLVFGVDPNGTPLYAEILPSRKTIDIKACLEQCEGILGGLDVVVSDGATPIHAALRRWHHLIIHVQHIHSGSRDQVVVHEIQPTPGKKRVKITTLNLHSKSLQPGRETFLKVREQVVYPTPLEALSFRGRRRKNRKKKKFPPKETINEILMPRVPKLPPRFQRKPRTSKKGWKFHLRMGREGNHWELLELEPKKGYALSPPSLAEEALKLLSITRLVFGDQCISSNRAETFNSVHDHRVLYNGQKTEVHAQRDLEAWQAVYFYPKASQCMLRAEKIHFPLTLVRVLLPWALAEVEIR